MPLVYSDDELLQAIRRWAGLYGRAPARTDWEPDRARRQCEPDVAAAKLARYRAARWPSGATVADRFGSFGAGVAAAGLRPRRVWEDVRWTDTAILEALRDVGYRRGRRPLPADFEEAELPCAEVVELQFGSWERALALAGV